MDNKIENIIGNFTKKILEIDLIDKSFDDKLKYIDLLVNNLIDYCIKKKIFYFIENKINYTNIIINFKTHLINFIKNLVDPSDTIINKYIISNNNNNNDNVSMSKLSWENVSDINSVLFNNFKKLNETFEKNVSFDNMEITNYNDVDDGFECNYENSKITNNYCINIKNLPIYIKLLVNQKKYLIEFTDKLIYMCKILSEIDIKYKKNNPYD